VDGLEEGGGGRGKGKKFIYLGKGSEEERKV
jgi:hypothetical protein